MLVVSSISKTDCHDLAEILLKVALNTITLITLIEENGRDLSSPLFLVRLVLLYILVILVDDKHALLCFLEKMLKIPKSQQEDVNRRTTDNDQKKRGKRANNDLHNITRITKI
jgi:hypothetical protein